MTDKTQIDPQQLNDLIALVFKLQSFTNVVIHKSQISYTDVTRLDEMIVMIHLPQSMFEAYLNKLTNENDFINVRPQGRA